MTANEMGCEHFLPRGWCSWTCSREKKLAEATREITGRGHVWARETGESWEPQIWGQVMQDLFHWPRGHSWKDCWETRESIPGGLAGRGKGRHCQKGLKFCPDSSLHLLWRTKAVNCCGGRRRRQSTLTAQGNWGEEKTLYLWDKEEHCITKTGLAIQKDNDPKFGSTWEQSIKNTWTKKKNIYLNQKETEMKGKSEH